VPVGVASGSIAPYMQTPTLWIDVLKDEVRPMPGERFCFRHDGRMAPPILLIVPYLRALIALPDVGDSQLAASCLGGVCFTQVGQRFVREGLNPNGAFWARIGICRSRSRPEK
jgi:hypothetical protein